MSIIFNKNCQRHWIPELGAFVKITYTTKTLKDGVQFACLREHIPEFLDALASLDLKLSV